MFSKKWNLSQTEKRYFIPFSILNTQLYWHRKCYSNKFGNTPIFLSRLQGIHLKEVFDTIFLDKLNYYGFREMITKWFLSYLRDRTQTTQSCSYISERVVTTCGFQICIRPVALLCFIMYIRDICSCANNRNLCLFGDDTNILYANKNRKSLEQAVNCELQTFN